MAKRDTGNGSEPDYSLAVSIIKKDVIGDREDISKIQGDLSASWKRVQDSAHVNKGAAKDALKVFQKSPETMADYLRSFAGMLEAFKIPGLSIDYNPGDLVDQAEDGEDD